MNYAALFEGHLSYLTANCNLLTANCKLLTANSLPLAFGLVVVVALTVFAILRMRKRRAKSCATQTSSAHDIDALVATLGEKALAYAVYREALAKGLAGPAKDALYAKFGYVNLPPSLESDKLFDAHPELMADDAFLAKLNSWISANGGVCKNDFFSASTEMGRILVEAKRPLAKQVV